MPVTTLPPVVASAESPHPDALSGRVLVRTRGLAQPVQCPTATVVALREEPRPEPGRTLRGNVLTPFDNRPAGRIAVVRGGDAPPAEGRTLVGLVGFGIPRRPVKPLVASPEVRAPAPGGVLTGTPPLPNLTPQQSAGEVVVAVREESPPEPGRVLARAFGRVPSERYFVRPVFAASEEPRPAEGRAVLVRVRLGNPPPNRPFAPVARAEEPRPEAGRTLVSRVWLELPPPVRARICTAEGAPVFAGSCLAEAALPPGLPLQQQPGRVVMAFAEAPRPEEGRTMLVTGTDAGATPPEIG